MVSNQVMDRRVTSKNLILALLIGALGGVVFHILGLPLAWMLGPMAFNMAAALRGMQVAVPLRLRSAMLAVLGVFLGSSFSPENLAQAPEWLWSIAAITAFAVLSTALVALYYRRVAGFDWTTALFSATPGAMTPMIIMGAAAGGDERRIAMAQALRITLVVLLIPPLVVAVSPDSLAPPLPPASSRGFDVLELLLLVAGSVLGILLVRLVRLPTPDLIGSMLVSAALYLSGVVDLALPQALLNVTLCVLGAAVGVRFLGTTMRELLDLGRYALGAVFLAVGLAALFAAAISAFLDVGYLTALLALTPGGVAEMCLIAVALDIDPAFVAVHHLARLLFLIAAAPLLGRLLRPAAKREMKA